MQMFSIQDSTGALALLRALKDPGSEAILQEITDREKALGELRKQTDARNDELNALAADLATRETALKQAVISFDQQRTITLNSIASRTAEVAKREEEARDLVAASTAQLAKDRAAVKDREDAVALREAPLKEREASVTARETAIAEREAAAAQMAADAQATIERFRALLPPAV